MGYGLRIEDGSFSKLHCSLNASREGERHKANHVGKKSVKKEISKGEREKILNM
jgi:hypothetical protein